MPKKLKRGPFSLSRYCMLREKRRKTFLVQFARPNALIWDHKISNNFYEQFWSVRVDWNKPRTAKVGAISKAQNCERGDPSGFVKLQLVATYEKKLKGDPLVTLKKFPENFWKKVIFEQCHSAEKCTT